MPTASERLNDALRFVLEYRRDHVSFRTMRLALGLQQKELAKLLELVPETISRYECGAGKIPITHYTVMSQMIIEASIGSQSTLRRLKRLTNGV